MKRQRACALHALADAKAEYENFFRYSHHAYIGEKISIARRKFAKSEFYAGYEEFPFAFMPALGLATTGVSSEHQQGMADRN